MEDFFEEQKIQSHIKATIVENYFNAWSKIIVSRVEKLGYIDLYSGPGLYCDGTPSTPIRILQTCIKNTSLHKKVVTIFNDCNSEYVKKLKNNIGLIDGINKLAFKPNIRNDEVSDDIAGIFSNMKMIPCFSFVDPFGYKGISLKLILGLTKDWGCDCLFFFNFNRVNAAITNPKVVNHINSIFGKESAEYLRTEVQSMDSNQRELLIMNELAKVLSNNSKNLVLPFKFISPEKDCTSHYLIFITKNTTGYQIMKEIMCKYSSDHNDGVGSFSFIPTQNSQLSFLYTYNKPLDNLEKDLLNRFSGKKLSVKQIYEKHNIGTNYILTNYKETLRRLEVKKKIICIPSYEERRTIKGIKTMADSVLIHFQ